MGTGNFVRSTASAPEPDPLRDLSMLGQRVALREVQLLSPHPITGDLKSGEVVGIDHDRLTYRVRCEIEVPMENVVRLT